MTTTVKTNGGRKRVSEIEQTAKAEIRKTFAHTAEVWDLAIEAAGLTTELGIPVQGERHLIASWAGVRAAICYATGQFKGTIEQQRRREKDLESEIDSLQSKLNERLEELRAKDREVVVGRVKELFAQHNGSNQLLSVVCEEIETGA
jgi:hypothetical protein